MAFADERALAERALELAGRDDGVEPSYPSVAQRFAQARESRGLTQAEVAAQWGETPSMYWDLELYDNEAFDVISVQDLVTLAAILGVSAMYLLFGDEPAPALSVTSYSEVVRRLRDKMNEESKSVAQMSDTVGWDLSEFLEAPEMLATLPIFGLRWVCVAAGVDWATTIGNPTARLATG